jgi:hypothetical protein
MLQERKLVDQLIVSEDKFELAMTRLFSDFNQDYMNVAKACQHLISLHRLSLTAKITDKLVELGLQFPNICTRPVIYFNKKSLAKEDSFYKVPQHQDWQSMQGSLNAMVVWVPLVDINQDLGALEVAPKSHLLGLLPSVENAWHREVSVQETGDFIAVEVEKGDALFFSAFLVHRSGNNIMDRIRWSCHFRYNDMLESTYRKNGYVTPYIYKPQQELIVDKFPSVKQVQHIFKIES